MLRGTEQCIHSHTTWLFISKTQKLLTFFLFSLDKIERNHTVGVNFVFPGAKTSALRRLTSLHS